MSVFSLFSMDPPCLAFDDSQGRSGVGTDGGEANFFLPPSARLDSKRVNGEPDPFEFFVKGSYSQLLRTQFYPIVTIVNSSAFVHCLCSLKT